VARGLVGAVLVRKSGDGRVREARITETEAYVEGDPANHAMLGPTRKNWSMFAGPGHLYVYRIHQVHCANVTTAPGEAVLLRAALPLSPDLGRMSGPGLLCRALELSRADDGLDVTQGRSPVRFESGGVEGPAPRIRTLPRVGIRHWRQAPLRFVLDEGLPGSLRLG
jgi:DNA-3-methyladenine glycosylase